MDVEIVRREMEKDVRMGTMMGFMDATLDVIQGLRVDFTVRKETTVLLMFVMESVGTISLLFMRLVMIQMCRQMMDAHQFAEFSQAIIVSIIPCLQDATLFVETEES